MRLIAILPVLLQSLLVAQTLDTVIQIDGKADMLTYVPEGNKLYVTAGYEDSVTGAQRARLCVIDLSTRAVRRVYDLGPNEGGAGDGGVWNWRRDKVYQGTIGDQRAMAVIDNSADSLLKWLGPMNAWRPSYDSRDDKVYAASFRDVAVIDCATDSVVKVITQPYYLSNFTAWDSVHDKVYAGSSYEDYVTVIDCSTDSVIAVIPTGVSEPSAPALYDERDELYVVSYWHGVAVIDRQRDSTVRRIDQQVSWLIRQLPVTVNPTEDKIYCPVWRSDSIYTDSVLVLRGGDDSITSAIPAFGMITAMKLAPWSNRLYEVAVQADTPATSRNVLQAIDCNTDSIVGRQEFGILATDIACNPFSREIYVSDWWDSAVYVFKDTIVSSVAEKPRVPHEVFNLSVCPSIVGPGVPLGVTVEADRATLGRTAVLKLFDCSGRLVAQQRFILDRPKVAISWTPSETPLAAGVYVLTTNTGQVRRKVVVR